MIKFFTAVLVATLVALSAVIAWAGPQEDFEKGQAAEKALDYTAALSWYRKSAETGFADAQLNLAKALDEGRGVAKNPTGAFIWYKRAALQGNAVAQYRLGQMYSQGIGVAKDGEEALKWFEKSAKAGIVKSQLSQKKPVSSTANQSEKPKPEVDTASILHGERQVRIVQQALNDEGYNPGKADGKFGKKTAAAIRMYEKEWELPVTGEMSWRMVVHLNLSQGVVGNKSKGQQSFSDGGRYEGQLRRSKRQGQGTYTFPNGTSYVGEWRANEINGVGTYKYKNGSTYKGRCQVGKPHGKGVFKTKDGKKISGVWRQGCLKKGSQIAWVHTTKESCKFPAASKRSASSKKAASGQSRSNRSYGGKGLAGKRGRTRGSPSKRGGCGKFYRQYIAASGHSAYAESVVVAHSRVQQSGVCAVALNRKNVAQAEKAAIASCLRGAKKYKGSRKKCVVRASK